MGVSQGENLRDLLAERFKLRPGEIKLYGPEPTVKWEIIADPHPYGYRIFITAYVDGKIEIDTGPVRTKDGIRDHLDGKNYERRYRQARTREEKEKVQREKLEEMKRILESFKQREYEKYLNLKGTISYYAKQHMWADEIAKRVSNKYGFEVKFEVDFESGFFTCFNSAGMSDEQLINEILKRVDAIDETRRMLLDESMMNEFLKNKGIVVKSRRSKKRVK